MAARAVRTARDNVRARGLGYKDYYDFRLHDMGRIPPDVDVSQLTPEERARRRGHRGVTDFLRGLEPGDVLIVPDGLSAIKKDEKGRFMQVRKLVIKDDGREQRFTLRRVSYQRMVEIIEAERKAGAVWSPTPSLDQRRLVNRRDQPGE